MFPYIHIGSFSLGTFGLFMWLAGVAGVVVLQRNMSRNLIKADAVVVVATSMIAGIFGAKLWHELQQPLEFGRDLHSIILPGWSHPVEILGNFLQWFRAGFAWYGGLLFGLGSLLWQGRSLRIGPLRMLDLAAPAAALGYGIGRIGCLTSGDGDYGINTTHPWGVHIHDDALDPPRPNPPGLLVEPTPLYELLFGLALAVYLWIRGRKQLPIGQITGEYLVLSGIGRFLVEFIRRNDRLYFGMTNAQVAALLTIAAGLAMIAYARKRGIVPVPPAVETSPAAV
ncbi:prolipoprotein diacylglyceryl transferase [Terriglobus aquaticus]|uniref:Prolipoprotein diacylglyceryl transferase n=1 Tax=Terriglobus aquaticus TaxID=940139 RepID=A0ABW9KJD6_9BACT|nr:prolipoprotein diacylglyceryl transferase [Terriglobus aquaticus]